MTGFGNARLAQHERIALEDLPRGGSGRAKIGFLN
jgi:hypothetical protein